MGPWLRRFAANRAIAGLAQPTSGLSYRTTSLHERRVPFHSCYVVADFCPQRRARRCIFVADGIFTTRAGELSGILCEKIVLRAFTVWPRRTVVGASLAGLHIISSFLNFAVTLSEILSVNDLTSYVWLSVSCKYSNSAMEI